MNERAHVEYFDWLRIIAALSVIFMHTAAGPLRAGINTGWHLLNVCTSLAFTAVPLFFMMSGYLLMTSRKTADISVLLRHRLPRLVVPPTDRRAHGSGLRWALLCRCRWRSTSCTTSS